MDPYGPSRWIDVFSRGPIAFNYNISSASYVKVSPSSGMLGGSSNNTDIRLNVTIDWASAPNGSTTSVINITTTTPSGEYLNSTNPYGNYQMPRIMVPVNKTIVPASFHGFVESDRTISIEAEHFSTNVSNSSSAYLNVIPSYGRTLSGVGLLPWTASSQSANSSSAPRLSYDFYTFTPNVTKANITTYIGMALNANPSRPLKYAISIDNQAPQVIQPIPSTQLGILPPNWTPMVSNAVTTNTTMHDLSRPGMHTLNLWVLEPNTIVQKLVVDLGGVRASYLGPPESVRL